MSDNPTSSAILKLVGELREHLPDDLSTASLFREELLLLITLAEQAVKLAEGMENVEHHAECRCLTYDDQVDPGGADCDCGLSTLEAFHSAIAPFLPKA